ncbi:MAG: hydantoinase/oxoprolinase N-terminal domain-containing protein [Caldilineaceae bacterium]
MTAAANTPETTLVGIDVGGTFTDFVVLQEGRLRIHKVPTTPDDQSRAIVAGLQELDIAAAEIVHGMTVATNALLERRGARTALLTTAGFGDVLVIGRQNRPHIYALHQTRPPALVDDAWRLEATERLDHTGAVLTPLDEADLERAVEKLAASEIESLAIVFLFAFRNPVHEEQAAARIRPDSPNCRCR